MAETFVWRSRIGALAEKVFEWHAKPGALERLTPPWRHTEVVEFAPDIRDGSRGTKVALLERGLGAEPDPLPVRIVAGGSWPVT